MVYSINKRIGYGFSLEALRIPQERDFVHAVVEQHNIDDADYFGIDNALETLEQFDAFCKTTYRERLVEWGFQDRQLRGVVSGMHDVINATIEGFKADSSYRPSYYSVRTMGGDLLPVNVDATSTDERALVEDEWRGHGLLVPALTDMHEWSRCDDPIDFHDEACRPDARPPYSRYSIIPSYAHPLPFSGIIEWETGEYVHDRHVADLIRYAISDGDHNGVASKSAAALGVKVEELKEKCAFAPPHLVIATALFFGFFKEGHEVWARRMNPMVHVFWT